MNRINRMILEKRIIKMMGITKDQAKSLVDVVHKGGDLDDAIAMLQNKIDNERKESGLYSDNFTPMIGDDLRWVDVVKMIFRVVDFNQTDTTIDSMGRPQNADLHKPYGFLLARISHFPLIC